MELALSYIIATHNRLPFLKITLGRLINELQPDEEIVVVDGNSTDGAKEYLQQLFEDGKIHQFISEPDKNQAHAWNKVTLMAKGIIIKKIIDDDVHDYRAIRKCKDLMLLHPEIDVCISNCLNTNLSNPLKIEFDSQLPQYLKWGAGNIRTFFFSDVYLLLRKSAISYIGLYDTQFKMMDWEYSLRISFLDAKIVYYTGCNSMSVHTPGNVTSTATKKLLKFEGKIGKVKYNYDDGISIYSHIKIFIGKFIHSLKTKNEIEAVIPPEDELKKIYSSYYKTLNEFNNKKKDWEFIYNSSRFINIDDPINLIKHDGR